MALPFLFTMGLCALSHALKVQALQMTDLLPIEEKVEIGHLSNGVKTYIQEYSLPDQCGSFRVVLKKGASEEELFLYDGPIHSMDSIEQFFNDCKEKILVDSLDPLLPLDDVHFASSDLPVIRKIFPREIGVVAVGHFLEKEMQSLVEKYFGGLELNHQTFVPEDAIQVGIDPKIPKVALSLSYPTHLQPIRTYSDLKETWGTLLLQDLFQQRLERCSKSLKEVWVHPHPRFFYPVNGHSLVLEEDCENLLALYLWQIEAIRSDGFYEEEFYIAKRNLLRQLQYLASRAELPDDAFLASYFADQFLLSDRCFSIQSFLDASAQIVEEIRMQDLSRKIDSFLLEKNRSIQIAYPAQPHSELLTKDHIGKIIERISFLASFYREGEIPEDEMWTFDTKTASSLKAHLAKTGKEELLLAEEYILPVDETDGVAPFYQLPLTEKEKRIIHGIITTMAEKNILQLAFVKRSMEKRGKKIEHIHPLRFIGYILANSELRSCLRSIKKSSFKWDAFIDGFSRRMREEYANNNIYIHIPGFCQHIGGNPEVVTRYIQRKDWEGLVKEHL